VAADSIRHASQTTQTLNSETSIPWSIVQIKDLIFDRTGGQIKIPRSEYESDGLFPIIDQGKTFSIGFTSDESKLYKGKLPVLLFGDHTREPKIVEQAFALGADGVKALEPCPRVAAKFLYFYLLHSPVAARGYSRHFKYLKEKEIPLPPLPEQHRIVEILDQADTLRRQRREADEVSERILPALFQEMFGDVFLNPHSWPMETLNNLGRVVTGSTPSSKLEGMFDGPIPFVTPTDLKDTWISHTRSVTAEGAAQSRTVRSGSALVCCIGTIGKMGKAVVESAFNQQINAVEWFDDSYDSYGLEALRQIKDQMISGASSTTLPIMNKSTFQALQIPSPPKVLREKFAFRVAELETVFTNQATSSATLETLFQTLLHRAFDGSLTAKWREGQGKELLQEMEHHSKG
jgi:type I restriction enzyme S subunit